MCVLFFFSFFSYRSTPSNRPFPWRRPVIPRKLSFSFARLSCHSVRLRCQSYSRPSHTPSIGDGERGRGATLLRLIFNGHLSGSLQGCANANHQKGCRLSLVWCVLIGFALGLRILCRHVFGWWFCACERFTRRRSEVFHLVWCLGCVRKSVKTRVVRVREGCIRWRVWFERRKQSYASGGILILFVKSGGLLRTVHFDLFARILHCTMYQEMNRMQVLTYFIQTVDMSSL